jgi:hypothetical protein
MSGPVQTYLRTLTGLTREGRLRLLAGIVGQLRDHGDALRSEPTRHLAPSSPYFSFDCISPDGDRLWRADCVINDSAAFYEVLQIVRPESQLEVDRSSDRTGKGSEEDGGLAQRGVHPRWC